MTVLRAVVPQTHRSACQFAAWALLLAFVLLPSRVANAQSARLEATYIVLGMQGPVARAILSNATQCPTITLNGNSQPMNVRAAANTDGTVPNLVCELLIPAGATAATINGRALPLPPPVLSSIAALGDTGCKLKAVKNSTADSDEDDDGKFQDCDINSRWPFSILAKRIAEAKPDLVIHVGDYLYRESPCPKNDKGCAGSAHGDNWDTWKADFFAPAAPLLQAAPWIMTRGNHETCRRAGTGYFRYLDPTLALDHTSPACIDLIQSYTVTVGNQSFVVFDSSDAADNCPKSGCNSTPYAEQFSSMHPVAGAWLVTHRPIWGLKNKNVTLNATLQAALGRWRGKLPPGITLALAGHIHLWEALSFADQRSPQFVLGNTGTLLAHKIKQPLKGQRIGDATVSFGRSEHQWGYTLFRPSSDAASWTATYYGISGVSKFSCSVSPTAVAC